MASLNDVVMQCLRAQFGDLMQGATDQTNLDRDLEMDSLDRIELAMAIEDETMISIDDDILNGAETIGDLVKAIERAAN